MSENTCRHCGQDVIPDQLCELNGDFFCPECYEALTVICACCGERIFRTDNAGDRCTPLCASCRDLEYTTCTRCGQLIHNDDACYFGMHDDDPYCESCMDAMEDHPIHNYNYKPQPIFHGEGTRYFGVELEIDEAGESDANAREILSVANEERQHVYCKHDGSLNDGFEIVTHPMTAAYHRESMPWERVLERARSLGYYSHQASTCGLHIHVNRSSFGENEDEVIARILYFVERHWNELLQFSRRTRSQLDRWAARYGYKDHPTELMEHVKKGGAGRYTCVNLMNDDTVEFRIFRGTLKYNTLIAAIQLVNRICDLAVCLSDEEIRRLTWSQFVSSVKEDELIRYLKERRLYVSEPVNGEEEI